jgi:hypothetical protein
MHDDEECLRLAGGLYNSGTAIARITSAGNKSHQAFRQGAYH